MRARFLPLLSVGFLLFAGSRAEAGEPFRYPEGKHGKGELRYINGLPVLTVAGTPEEIGEQVALLAVKPAARLLDYPKDILRQFRSEGSWPFLIKVGSAMLAQFPADHRRELEAMIQASGCDRELLVAANTMFDIKKIAGCSSLIVAAERSQTQGPLFGRNLDFPTAGYLQEYSLVTVYRPEGKRPFVSIGFPGIVGCLSGMNDAGLSLAVHEVYASADGSVKFDPTGVPYALTYRRILEECATVEEAAKLLNGTKRTTMTSLGVCDRQRGAILEATPKSLIERPTATGTCACTNHFCCETLAVANQPNIFKTLDRYRSLEQASLLAKLGLVDVARGLHAANQRAHTVQSMIFEPAALRLHLAIGASPSSELPYILLDLRPHLRGF